MRMADMNNSERLMGEDGLRSGNACGDLLEDFLIST
jgi:hypothetical protein